MAEKSIFDPNSDRKYPGGGRYGIDPSARKTHIPEHLRDGDVETDADLEAEVDCAGADADQPICDLADAKKQVDDEKLRDQRVQSPDSDL